MVKFYRTDDKLIHELDTLQGGTWIQMVNPSVAEGQMVADELNVDIEDVLAALDEEETVPPGPLHRCWLLPPPGRNSWPGAGCGGLWWSALPKKRGQQRILPLGPP